MSSDYSSWKVPDLKNELKNREIPQSGLRLKQQFIDRLLEDDAAKAASAAPVESEGAQRVEEEGPQEPRVESADKAETQEELLPAAAEPERDVAKDEAVAEKEVELEAPPPKPEAEEPTKEPIVQTGDVQMADVEVTKEQTENGEPTKAAAEAQTSKEELTQQPESIPPEEVMEDMRKRKRRSVTPVPVAEEITKKRIRSDDDGNTEGGPVKEAAAPGELPKRPTETRDKKNLPDARFKGLFKPREPEPLRPVSPPARGAENETQVEPALHVETTALYIDGLMRPLQPASLRNHLASLASAPGEPPNPDVITEFYLDPIKSHCFVGFTDVSAASRVRSALHGSVWPNERNRKSLFVDFLPEEKLPEWIGMEERGGRRMRWGVRYDTTGGGVVEAIHQEINPKAAAAVPPGEPGMMNRRPPPQPPRTFTSRGDQDRMAREAQKVERSHHPGQGFKALDELFKSTAAKPKLYYQTVPRDVVDRRLDQFDDIIRKGSFPRRGGGEMRRITFEDTDFFVDNGAEFGNRRGGGGGGARRGGGPRGRRGGMKGGDSWRRY